MIKIQEKLQKLIVQKSKSQNQAEAEQLQRKIDLLTEEMTKEGERLWKEIEPQLEEYENSLPPTLKKIHKLDNEISTLDDNLIANSEKINTTSKEILQLMGELYLSENEIPSDLTSMITSLKFCKEITINYELKGKGHLPDAFEINYNIAMQLKSYWTLDYHVDVIQRKGYLNSHTIESIKNETYPEKIENIKFSGWITDGVLTNYSYNPGTGSVIIGPSKLKELDYNDPNTWPDELVSTYSVGYVPPFILFSSSQNQAGGLVQPIPCATNINNLTYIAPEELNKGIREGKFTKVITKDTFFPNCDESTITISIDFPNMLCDQHADKGALATADACIDHGGFVLATEDNVFAHGKPVARVGDEVLCLRHGITQIVGDKDVKVFSDKERIARVGDKTKCGGIIMGGSFSVFAGEK
jgi:uncharacterized Zn-binding protein involved in type VI secretion